MSRRATRTAPGADEGYHAELEAVRQREEEALAVIAQVAAKYPRPLTLFYTEDGKEEKMWEFKARAMANDVSFGMAILKLYKANTILNSPTKDQCDAVIKGLHDVAEFDKEHAYEGEVRLLDIKGMIGAVMRRNYVDFVDGYSFKYAVEAPEARPGVVIKIVAEASGDVVEGLVSRINSNPLLFAPRVLKYLEGVHSPNQRLDAAYKERLASKVVPPPPDSADVVNPLRTFELYGGAYCWLGAMVVMLRAIPGFTKTVRADAYASGDPQSIEISKAVDHFCVYKGLSKLIQAFGYKSTIDRNEVELFNRFATRFPSLQLGKRYELAEKLTAGSTFVSAYFRLSSHSTAILLNENGEYVKVSTTDEKTHQNILEVSGYSAEHILLVLVDTEGEPRSKRSRMSTSLGKPPTSLFS